MKTPRPGDEKSLIINKQAEKTLSKEQQTFNRLIKRIEKLQAELEKSARTLDQKLDFYGKQIYPLEQREIVLLKDLTRSLYQFFQESHLFSRNDRAILGEIISVQWHNIIHLEQTEPDAEFKEIFRAVEHRDYDEAAEEELDSIKEEMQARFADMGLDLDLEDMDRTLTEEELFEKITQIREQLQQQAKRNGAAPKRKTKKQLEKEANEKKAEEARAKSLNSIYKQLVKIFHPDLEQDPDRRLEKEELMKKLTTSYKSGDLHTLLKLELQWIQQEGVDLDKLTDEKLALYNESLKQQTNELEEELRQLVRHPRYQPLYQFARSPDQLPYISFSDIKRQKKSLLESLTQSLQALQGNANKALSEIREVIYSFKNQG